MTIDEFREAFERRNVLNYWPGWLGKGTRFSPAMARPHAERIVRESFIRGRLVIVLGKRAASAFGFNVEYFEKFSASGATVVVMPHPSGINRWWNDRKNVTRARRFLRSVRKEAIGR